MLVPTTVLAQQHLGTFRRRLAPFPVRVEMLSRFVGKAEQTKIVEATTGGEVDILIGTHRILSKDIAFADLGAGGRRGAALRGRPQGRIKSMRREVDVLTLSALPIPNAPPEPGRHPRPGASSRRRRRRGCRS